jgi:hypothetical protein
MEINKGDILFSFSDAFIQDLIEDITKGASHVAVCCGNGKVIEAQALREVGYSDLSIYLSNYKIYRLPNSQENIENGIQWLLKQFGRPYSYWSIFVLFVRCVFRFKLPWKEGWGIICSRLVRDFLFQSKLNNIPDIIMTPRDVEDWIISNGGILVDESLVMKE